MLSFCTYYKKRADVNINVNIKYILFIKAVTSKKKIKVREQIKERERIRRKRIKPIIKKQKKYRTPKKTIKQIRTDIIAEKLFNVLKKLNRREIVELRVKDIIYKIKKIDSFNDEGKYKVTYAINQNHTQQIELLAAIPYLKGLIELQLDNNAGAKLSFAKALKVQPDFVLARENLDAVEKFTTPKE